jgi:uncharacterized protein
MPAEQPPAMTRLARSAGRLLRTLAVLYLAVLLLMMSLENWFIYHPSKYPDGDWHPAGLTVEDATFDSADGTTLHGWYAAAKEPLAVALFCHGNAGNVTHRADAMRALNQIGVSVLVFDYRGYGRSAGSPNEPGILADARAARGWLAKRTGLAERDIILIGESLGGAVAVDLAASDGARALVLENTFGCLADVAAHHYPIFPVRFLMRTKLDSTARIKNYHGPLLQCHGDADTIVPIAFARCLFEAANEPKQFITLPGHDHNDPLPPRYYAALQAMLKHQPRD